MTLPVATETAATTAAETAATTVAETAATTASETAATTASETAATTVAETAATTVAETAATTASETAATTASETAATTVAETAATTVAETAATTASESEIVELEEKSITDKVLNSTKQDLEGQRQEFDNYVRTHGLHNYGTFLDNYLNQWKKSPLRIGITGSSGQGKSSLINTMRGLKPKSFGAAKVGVVECTMSVNEYPDIKNPNLIYYDLPGVGTSNYPRNEYFKIIKSQTKDGIEFQDFDFFLIVSATRFTEDDIWLSQQIQKGGKQFYFVRTKIDFDLANAREDDPDNYDEANVLQEIRDNCLKELMKISMVNSASYEDRVFLLSTKLSVQEKWDFSKMVRSLLHDYPALKRDAMVLSVTSYCKDVIREKANVLRNEIWKIALASAIGAIVPIGGLGAVIDFGLINTMTDYYKESLGLDRQSLNKLADAHNMTMDDIDRHMNGTAWSHYFSVGRAATHVLKGNGGETAAKLLLEQGSKLIPVVSAVVCSTISYGSTCYQLHALLDNIEKATLEVFDYVTRVSTKQVTKQ